MDFDDERISQMLAGSDIVISGRPEEKLYRYVDDGMRWRLAVLYTGYTDWVCFEDGKYVGTMHTKDSSRTWVNRLD